MRTPSLRLAMTLVALLAFAGAAAGIGARATYGAQTTADEPHYLLALPMAAGGWVLAKLALCVVAGALAALTLWIAVRRLAVPVTTAVVVVGVLALSAPLAAYGSRVYPEIVAALVVAASVAALTGRLGRGGVAVLAPAVIALPWLSIEYAPVATAPAGLALWRLARSRRIRDAVALGAGLALAVLAIAWWAREGGRRLAAAVGLGAIGVVAQAFVVVEALRGGITWVVNLQDTENPLYRAWRTVLPDYLGVTPTTEVLHTAWALAAVAAAVLAYRRAAACPRGTRSALGERRPIGPRRIVQLDVPRSGAGNPGIPRPDRR